MTPEVVRPIVCFAPAKLNLFLEIVGKRPDGFHDLETLMLAVDLYDTIEIEPSSTIELTSNDPDLPCDERNLVWRAAAKWDTGCRIRLTKRIPSQAGMGGGSSDAAATLLAMQNFGPGPIRDWANQLGSDVGFFLGGSAAWCTGRGEIVEPIPAPQSFHFVAVQPPVGCPTGEVYKRLNRSDDRRSGSLARQAVAEGDPEKLARAMFNRLEEPAKNVAPEIDEVVRVLTRDKPLAVQVTGSGSAVFALCQDRDEAIGLAERYRVNPDRKSDKVWVLRSISTTTT